MNHRSSLNFAKFTFIAALIIATANSIFGQTDEQWHFVDLTKDPQTGKEVVTEKRSDGSTKTTTISMHVDKKTKKISEKVVSDAEGNKLEEYTEVFGPNSKPVSYSEKFYVAKGEMKGKQFEGNGWKYNVDSAGNPIGQKYERKYDPDTGKWKEEPTYVPKTSFEPTLSAWEKVAIQLGTNPTLKCPANPNKEFTTGKYGLVYFGSNRYAIISAVCVAAVHEGIITFQKGGDVRIRFVDITREDHQASIAAGPTTKNGIQAKVLLGSGTQAGFVFVR